jgi:hypothetical protein
MSDPFSLLGLPETFDLEPARIQRAYLARASALAESSDGGLGDDPDAGVTLESLNEAKTRLMKTEQRASVLLALLSLKSKAVGDDRALPSGFLPHIMDVRQQIDDALAADREAAVEHWRAWALAQRHDHERRASDLFRKAAAADTADRPAILHAIRVDLNAWRYVERLIEQL